MTQWTHSAVLIAPAPLLDAANALAVAMGWSEGPEWPAYTVPLSPTGAEPATHWGLRIGAAESFEAMIDAARAGVLPEALAGAFPPAQVAALVGALIVDIRADAAGHFAAAIGAAALQVVLEDGEI